MAYPTICNQSSSPSATLIARLLCPDRRTHFVYMRSVLPKSSFFSTVAKSSAVPADHRHKTSIGLVHHPSESISLEIYMRVRMNHQSIDYVLYEQNKRIGFRLPRTHRTIGICKHHIPERFPHFTRNTIGKMKTHTQIESKPTATFESELIRKEQRKKNAHVTPRPHPHAPIQNNNSEFRLKKKQNK